jgi:hypothetical protein
MRLFPAIIFASLLASTLSQAADPELEGRDGLSAMCQKTPGNMESFCTCWADNAVAELPRQTRQYLYVIWTHPTDFNFRAPMAARNLASVDEERWGPWQRKTVATCSEIQNRPLQKSK